MIEFTRQQNEERIDVLEIQVDMLFESVKALKDVVEIMAKQSGVLK